MGDDDDLVRRLATDPDEYLRCCGIVGLGRLLTQGAAELADELREHACDPSWRAREAVAIALQRLGDQDLGRLRTIVAVWVTDDRPLVWRAAIAAICEPRLLKDATTAAAALDACASVTAGLAAVPASDRRRADVRTLRQALGYCWSVAVAAEPVRGLAAFATLRGHGDPDVGWVVRENLRKARLRRILDDPRSDLPHGVPDGDPGG
ncbi:MAG: HEAT repeat domain-containing protein [Cellulomonas sp.]